MRSPALLCAFLLTVSLALALTPNNPGDLNGDGLVNIQDVYIVSGCLGQSATNCQSGRADPNNDGLVNLFDFVHVSQQWGTTYSTPTPTVLLSEYFENNQLSTRGWYDAPNGLLSTTEFVPGSTASMEYRFNAGASTPTQGKTARHAITATEQVYVSFWIKYSSNWVGSQVSYHPHQFYLVNDLEPQYIGPSITHSTFYIEENGGKPLLAHQDALNIDQSRINQNLIGVSENRATAGCNGNADSAAYQCYAYNTSFYTNAKSWKSPTQWFSNTVGPTYKNNWHFVEAYFKLNSVQNGVGVADGIAQYWYDGQSVININNALFRTGANANMKINQFIIGPYIGVGSPVNQSFWVDNLTIMTARPGSYTPPPTDTTNPSVSLSAPAAGATVSGTTTISASASDNVAVQSVQFTFDGANFGAADTTSPYSISWDTTTTSNAQHTLGAVATDTSGNTASAATRTVTVNNVAAPSCGNGIIESGEQCDGAALGGATCITRGFSSGTLSCSASCTYDTSACTGAPSFNLRAHEPTGMTSIIDMNLAAKDPAWTIAGSTSFQDAATYTPPLTTLGVSIIPPGIGPASPSGIFQIKVPYHHISGSGSGSTYPTPGFSPQAKTLYAAGCFQMSSNWYGESTGTIKMVQPRSNTAGVDNRLIYSAQGANTNALTWRIAFQSTVVPGISTAYYSPFAGTGKVNRGQWHCFETVVVGNSAGTTDGSVRVWLDGNLTHNMTGLQFDANAVAFKSLDLNSVYGGPTVVNATPDDQYIWWDHLYISYSTSQK